MKNEKKQELIEEINLKFEEFCKIMDAELNLEEDNDEEVHWNGKQDI